MGLDGEALDPQAELVAWLERQHVTSMDIENRSAHLVATVRQLRQQGIPSVGLFIQTAPMRCDIADLKQALEYIQLQVTRLRTALDVQPASPSRFLVNPMNAPVSGQAHASAAPIAHSTPTKIPSTSKRPVDSPSTGGIIHGASSAPGRPPHKQVRSMPRLGHLEGDKEQEGEGEKEIVDETQVLDDDEDDDEGTVSDGLQRHVDDGETSSTLTSRSGNDDEASVAIPPAPTSPESQPGALGDWIDGFPPSSFVDSNVYFAQVDRQLQTQRALVQEGDRFENGPPAVPRLYSRSNPSVAGISLSGPTLSNTASLNGK